MLLSLLLILKKMPFLFPWRCLNSSNFTDETQRLRDGKSFSSAHIVRSGEVQIWTWLSFAFAAQLVPHHPRRESDNIELVAKLDKALLARSGSFTLAHSEHVFPNDPRFSKVTESHLQSQVGNEERFVSPLCVPYHKVNVRKRNEERTIKLSQGQEPPRTKLLQNLWKHYQECTVKRLWQHRVCSHWYHHRTACGQHNTSCS